MLKTNPCSLLPTGVPFLYQSVLATLTDDLKDSVAYHSEGLLLSHPVHGRDEGLAWLQVATCILSIK